MANFGHFFEFFGYKIHILGDIELKLAENMSLDCTYRINLVSLKNILKFG